MVDAESEIIGAPKSRDTFNELCAIIWNDARINVEMNKCVLFMGYNLIDLGR